MRFYVHWLQQALDELAAIWTQADSEQRKLITEAAHAIDERLSKDPLNEGESRLSGRRITFLPPLSVRFQIEADGQTVTVLHVRLFRRRSE